MDFWCSYIQMNNGWMGVDGGRGALLPLLEGVHQQAQCAPPRSAPGKTPKSSFLNIFFKAK